MATLVSTTFRTAGISITTVRNPRINLARARSLHSATTEQVLNNKYCEYPVRICGRGLF